MADYKYWIALEQAKGMGPVHLKKLYDLVHSKNLTVKDLFPLSAGELKSEFHLDDASVSAIQWAEQNLVSVEEHYFKLIDADIEPLLFHENKYPPRLEEFLKNSYPPVLYSYGNRDLLANRGAAVLGESEISEKGELIAYRAAKELSRRNITVIGGMATGAGLISHRSALENHGDTIAVLPYGFFHFKPPEILKDVLSPENFLILSPFYPTKEYSPFQAMQRNKIICALSFAVYIIEATAGGGILEAGKSAKNLGVPLYTTEYSETPKSAEGNKTLLEELNAQPVRGRMIQNVLTPNLDKLIADVKFSEE